MSARGSVLVIEDDKDLRALYRTALVLDGFDVIEAANGLEGLRRLDSNTFDLIVLDMGLPALSGRAFLLELMAKADTRKIPVVACLRRSARRDGASFREAHGAFHLVVTASGHAALLDDLDRAAAVCRGRVRPAPRPRARFGSRVGMVGLRRGGAALRDSYRDRDAVGTRLESRVRGRRDRPPDQGRLRRRLGRRRVSELRLRRRVALRGGAIVQNASEATSYAVKGWVRRTKCRTVSTS
jgi:CheY-like chemotaxis protein